MRTLGAIITGRTQETKISSAVTKDVRIWHSFFYSYVCMKSYFDNILICSVLKRLSKLCYIYVYIKNLQTWLPN